MRAVILAGGSGTRLWPLSRAQMPKQFLPLVGEGSLFQETVERVRSLVGDDVCVVTTEETRFLVAAQLAALGIDPEGKVISEPAGRNTAPAIGLAALAADPDEVLLVLPSDHAMTAPAVFQDAARRAAAVADAGLLVTFGIAPSSPETGYGYIRMGVALEEHDGFRVVERFVEKPDRETAEDYLADGGYVWNSGMFAFRAGVFLEELSRHALEVFSGLEPLRGVVVAGNPVPTAQYEALPKISIDYAVMERSHRVAVLPMDPGWSDLGSFGALWEVLGRDPDGNAVRMSGGGEAVLVDARRNLVLGGERVVALVGVEDLAVVDTPDALLVAPREHSQEVRRVVEHLQATGRPEADVPRTVPRPWGAYTVLEEGKDYKIKRIQVHPGGRLSLQLHHRRSEQWVVVAGTARVTVDDRVLDLAPGQGAEIPVAARHRLENPGREPLQLIEVQSGAYLGEDDIVRLEDDYGRVGR
ncbi:MAG: mannose-1-phosphate guanylyltransferase/mannose-6-phosphate isomerase [Deferrisomatales bacterium]|nr:mannose-1-phosphate guanylyltransferase/mannose-6-phosphate isomerase [Deferrisomatales bacterium]